MLRDDVVEAVRSGQFHIWTVEDVDALLQLLTGLPCGEPDGAGIYPEGSLHRLVSDRLDDFGRTLRAASAGEERNPQERST
jgi:predicted ATP-dependent protease